MSSCASNAAAANGAGAAVRALRILVADDHAVVRDGVRLLIEREAGWQVCGVATNGREAVAQALELRPDVVVLDLHMPELDGLGAVRELKKRLPATELVIFSGQNSERMISELFDAGARSFIRKVDAPRLLVQAIQSAAQHKPFFTREVSAVLFSRFMDGAEGARGPGSVTTREREIIRLIAEGKSNKETADTLGISTRTIETHRAAIMRKLHLGSTADLVRYAIRNGIVEA